MKILAKALFVLSLFFCTSAAFSEEGDMSIGTHANIVLTYGTPSNDVPGVGLILTYQLKDAWFVDIEYIQSEADYERPWQTLGIQQDESTVSTVDAVYSSSVLMVHMGKNIKGGSANYDWYWSAGLGFNSVSVDDAQGPVLGGGNFNITTDAGTETLIGFKVGMKYHLSNNWDMHYALRLDHHIADWTVTDTVSSATGKIDDYALHGFLIGVERNF